MNRMWRYVALVSMLAALLLAACAPTSPPATPTAVKPPETAAAKPPEKPTATSAAKPTPKPLAKIRFGWLPVPVLLPVYLAEDKGFFKEQGLEVEFVKFPGGAQILEAAFAGAVDMGHSGVPALLLAAAQGKLLTVVTGAADLGVYKGKVYGLHGLMVPLDSTIRGDKPENTLSDLVGKTVAVVTKSSPDFVFFSIRLRNAGIDPGKVDIVELPWPSMPAALTAKKVDAAVVVDPFRSQVLAQNMGKDLGDAVIGDQKWGSVVGDQLLPQAINFSTVDFINKEPASVQAFMRAVGKAYDFMNDPANKQVLTEVTAKWSGLPAPIVAGMKEMPWVRRDKGFMDDYSGLEYLMNLWVKYGFLDKPVDIKKMVALPW